MAEPKAFQEMSVAELIAYCAYNNDPASWMEFVRRFHSRIIFYLMRELRAYGQRSDDAEIVQDLIQDVYLRLLANERSALRGFRGENAHALPAYLACIVRSVMTSYVRRESSKKRAMKLVPIDDDSSDNSRQKLADRLAAGDETSPERMLVERLTPQRLSELLKIALTGSNAMRDSLIFKLHVLDGLTSAEIAALPTFGMTEFAVMAVIRRTKERLRELLNNSDASSLSV